MGNWRTVTMIGTCAKDEVKALQKAIYWDRKDDNQKFHCLMNTGSLCGFGNWAGEEISHYGNLAERDYSVEDIANTLKDLIKIAPSLELKINCGGEYESEQCVATIVVKNGVVSINPPEVVQI